MSTSTAKPRSRNASSSREAGRTPATTTTSSKARKRSASSRPTSSAEGRPRTASARTSASSKTRKAASRAAPEQTPREPTRDNGSGPDRKATIAKGAAGAIAGTAAVGLATWAAMRRQKHPRVFGVQMPRINGNGIRWSTPNVKTLAKKIGEFAERVEHTSEGVRDASVQTQKVTRRLS